MPPTSRTDCGFHERCVISAEKMPKFKMAMVMDVILLPVHFRQYNAYRPHKKASHRLRDSHRVLRGESRNLAKVYVMLTAPSSHLSSHQWTMDSILLPLNIWQFCSALTVHPSGESEKGKDAVDEEAINNITDK